MYNGVKVLDVHGHVSGPGNGAQQMGLMLASNTALNSPLKVGKSAAAPGLTDDDFRKTGQNHVDLLDDRQIDAQLIGPRPFMMLGWMQPHLLPGWVRFNNDMIAKQCELFPERFLGAAQLPQISTAPDLSHCLPELERCHKDLGFVAAYLSPDPAGQRTTPGMHEPYWDPVYAYCEKNDLPIIVHGTNSLDPRIGIIPQNYQIGFATEQYIATQLSATATSSSASQACGSWCATAAAASIASSRATTTSRRRTSARTCSSTPTRSTWTSSRRPSSSAACPRRASAPRCQARAARCAPRRVDRATISCR